MRPWKPSLFQYFNKNYQDTMTVYDEDIEFLMHDHESFYYMFRDLQEFHKCYGVYFFQLVLSNKAFLLLHFPFFFIYTRYYIYPISFFLSLVTHFANSFFLACVPSRRSCVCAFVHSLCLSFFFVSRYISV